MTLVRRIFLFTMLAFTIMACEGAHSVSHRGLLQVHFLDVGQGDSIYVRTPSGRDMLVDGGLGASVLERLSKVMPWDDRVIDVVVATHPDADHIGGLPEVLSRYRVGMFLEPGVESDNSIDDELDRIILEKSISAMKAKRGMRVNFGDGAVFDVLFPDKDVSHTSDTNTASIVGKVRYGATAFMLTGDSPKAVENHLASLDGHSLKSDVLKAGHHGSRTSSDEKYVRTVAPAYAVISAGKDNRYGHPHAEVIETLEKSGVKVLRTDVDGTVSFVSDGKSVERK